MNTIARHILSVLPDKLYLDLQFYNSFHRFPNWKSPKTFNEKIQWLKLYDRNPDYVKMVDKYAVKDIVAGIIGSEHVIPTLGVWNRAEDIEWEKLPNKFVLKTTHGGGNEGVVICKDKMTFDREGALRKLTAGLKHDSSAYGREWPYRFVKRRIIAEQYIDPAPNVSDLPDYKWYCFNGEPKYCQVIQDRSTKETIDFFDVEWNHQEFVGLNPAAGPAALQPTRPSKLETHIRIARMLSKDIPFSRIDLYETGDNTYFGEVTLYPNSGLGVLTPERYNEFLGQMITLPGEKRGGVIIRQLQDKELRIEYPDLPDYKFFCFDGEPKMLFVGTERNNPNTETRFDFFDIEYNHLDILNGHPQADSVPSRPDNYDEMVECARRLSEGYAFLRVDLYTLNGKIYFGETTFFHHSGMVPFVPGKWDDIMGAWIKLPQKYNG